MSRSLAPAPVEAILAFLAILWAGMLIGVSFLATPVKFSAPGLTLPVALEVGRVTFHLFSRIEWAAAAGLLLASVLTGRRAAMALSLLLALVVAMQGIWLLPALDARIDAVAAGTPLPPSSHHAAYAVAEVTKVLTLLALAWPAWAALSRGHGRS